MAVKQDVTSYEHMSLSQLYAALETDARGLSSEEVAHRQARFGRNEIPQKETTWWYIAYTQLTSPFMIMFVAIMGVLLFIGEWTNALLIGACMIIHTLISFIQEYKATLQLSSLKQYLTIAITVYRDGQEAQVPPSDLVVGDIILLHAGDIIPADVRFIAGSQIVVDESALTGESGPINKKNTSDNSTSASQTIGYAGTTMLQGKATAIVYAIGRESSLGKLAMLTLETIKTSNLAKSTVQMGKYIMRMVGVILLIVFTLHLLFRTDTMSWYDLFIFSVALAISAIPEVLPVVVTVCLSRGASYMAQHKVIIKRLSAIEDLGRIEVLCTDKTGTLTENSLEVSEIIGPDPDELIAYAFWGNNPTPGDTNKPILGFDAALATYVQLHTPGLENIQHARHDYLPFDPITRMSAVALTTHNTTRIVIRGMYEELCKRAADITAYDKLAQEIAHAERNGLRVLTIGYAPYEQNTSISQQITQGITIVGAIAFKDPLKKTAPEALSRAHQLGIQVKIISGDSALVCGSVATQLGLINYPDAVLSGDQFAALSEEEKIAAVNNYHVFARTYPDQKFEIITLLQRTAVVGYMGDGINDAPALKAADVSLVVKSASPLAQDTADIILLKKSLLSIVDGIGQGRIVVVNILKYITITISANLGNFYAIAIVSIWIDYLPMLPAQILLLNVISDLPMIAISTDTVDQTTIAKPQQYSYKDILILALMLGMISTLFDFIYFMYFKQYIPTVVQTGWFVYSILTEVVLIFSIRTQYFFFASTPPSRLLLISSLGVAVIGCTLPYIPRIGTLLKFTPLSIFHMCVIGGIVLSYWITTEYVKSMYYTRIKA